MKPTNPYRRLKPLSKILAVLGAGTMAAVMTASAGSDGTPKDPGASIIQQVPFRPKFFVEAGAAGEFDEQVEKFITNGSADFGPAGIGGLPGKIQSRDFNAAHDAGTVDGRFRLGYIVSQYVSIYTMFSYSHSGGNSSRSLGFVTDVNGRFGPVGNRYDLYGDVGQYQSFSQSLGARISLPRTILDAIHAPKFITPYFNISAGGKYVDKQNVRFYTAGIDAVDTTEELYRDSWVFTVEGGLGYEFKLAQNFSINLDSNYGYDTKPGRGGQTVGGSKPSGSRGINKGGDRFYSTVGLSAVFKF